ncbi:nuclear pore complex protein NUP88 [Aristolochia californica]|uniref:nuclear pore complex protein NUP88 n=1 Tax=Aristolochia californica TaxID=171875 RepID=UPI0035DD7A45
MVFLAAFSPNLCASTGLEKDYNQLLQSPMTPTNDDKFEWINLPDHPIFSTGLANVAASIGKPCNLAAWHEPTSHLYLWDSNKLCLHRILLRFGEDELDDHSQIFAASPAKTFRPDIHLQFGVCNIAINRAGTSLVLVGSGSLYVMHLYKRTSTKDGSTICRAVSIGSHLYVNDDDFIEILQVSWHPHSDTHLGVLSSDSVLRLFDLSNDTEEPEQEFYLQPLQNGSCQNATSIRPVAYAFGGEHMWDRFSVFFVFSDGSVYVLCPVVPFGSIYSWACVEEVYKDAQALGLNSSNARAVKNSSLAVSWLEATFPQIVDGSTNGQTALSLKALPYAQFDLSLSLQGPLHKVSHSEEDQDSNFPKVECKGQAVGFLYNSINKDSVLVIAWSTGQLQVDALADELQPLWSTSNPPRFRFDSSGLVMGTAMICESASLENFSTGLHAQVNAFDTVWLGQPPPLLTLALVDLALPTKAADSKGCLLSIFSDPLVPEKIYCIHNSGIDLIFLHFLPFSSQMAGKEEAATPPSVRPILTLGQNEMSSEWLLCGFAALADSFGNSWVVGFTSSQDCIVIKMKSWDMAFTFHADRDEKLLDDKELSEIGSTDIISKELLLGPKTVLLPQGSSTLRSLNPDSIEGRSTLHQYFKLFHENYVQYAHKVYIQLILRSDHLKRTVADQHARLSDAKQMLSNVEGKQPILEDRLKCAVQAYALLVERLQSFKSLSGANKRPLSRAEREFKSQIDQYKEFELGALHSSIETLKTRLRRHMQYSQANITSPKQVSKNHRHVPPSEDQISYLKSSISKLSIVNSENSKKVKLVESTLKGMEASF